VSCLAESPDILVYGPILDLGFSQSPALWVEVKLDQLTEAWAKNDWIKNNALIAVAGGEKDGMSGLRDATASFAAQRKHVERIAHIVFSANWHWGRILSGAARATLLGVSSELADSDQGSTNGKVVIHLRNSAQDTTVQVGQEITCRNLSVQSTLTIRPGFSMDVTVIRIFCFGRISRSSFSEGLCNEYIHVQIAVGAVGKDRKRQAHLYMHRGS